MILAGGYYEIDGEYDKLSGIAPVVAYRGTQLSYGWRPHARDVGRALGVEGKAGQSVAGVEDAIGDARAAHPEFEGKTVSYSFHFEPNAIQTINSPEDFAAQFLGELGLRLAPTVLGLKGTSGAQISLERLGLLDADMLIMAFASAELQASLESSAVFATVPAVSRENYVPVSLDTVTAVRNPSVLSIPYGLEQLVPELAAAFA